MTRMPTRWPQSPIQKTDFARLFSSWNWDIATSLNMDDVRAEISMLAWKTGLPLVLLTLAVALFSVLFARNIARPFHVLISGLKNSDLTLRLPLDGEDEFSKVAKAFNDYNAKVHAAVVTFAGSSGQVAAGSTQLAATAEEMSAAVVQIAGLGEELLQSGEQVTRAMDDLSANAGMVAVCSGEIETAAHAAETVTDHCIEKGRDASRRMEEVRAATLQILDAAGVIQEISKQTNLLSLNAAIEASKAGAAGKGFRIVAEEVQKLADRSRQSADAIGHLVERTRTAVDAGVEGVGSSIETLEAMGVKIHHLSARVNEIGAAARSQAETSGKVTGMIAGNQMQITRNASATLQLDATVREISRTASDLAAIADSLRTYVGGFKS